MLSSLTIYSFDNFLHKIVYQCGTLCILSGHSLCNIFRDTETIRDQLIKDVNKGVVPQVQFKPQKLQA